MKSMTPRDRKNLLNYLTNIQERKTLAGSDEGRSQKAFVGKILASQCQLMLILVAE
jgi:hypothetical protein